MLGLDIDMGAEGGFPPLRAPGYTNSCEMRGGFLADSGRCYSAGSLMPFLSNFRFGNDIFANLGQSRATLSGFDTLGMNLGYAQLDPVPLFDSFPIGGVQQPVPQPAPDPRNDQPEKYQQTNAEGSNRFLHLFKLQFIALIALVLLAVGLYLLSQQTELGRSIKDKAVSGVKKGVAGAAGGPAAAAAV